ncbi:MAG: MFS transporter [Ardenticatenaceae bacterium]|nr:MFS transporter [Ardenticatenaceae bacterium]
MDRFSPRFASILLIASFIILGFQRSYLAITSSYVADEFNLNYASLGTLGAAFFYAFAAVQLPVGIAVDRAGVRRTVGMALTITALGSILFSIASNPTMAVVARGLTGAGLGGIYVPALKLFASTQRKDFGVWNGMLIAGGHLGGLVALTPLLLVTVSFGWRLPMLVVGVLTLVLIPPLLWSLHGWQEPLNLQGQGTRATRGGGPRQPRVAASNELARHLLWLLIPYTVIVGHFLAFNSLWAGSYFDTITHWPEATIGLLLSIFPIALALGAPLAGAIADRGLISQSHLTTLGYCGFTLGWCGLLFVDTRMPPWQVVALLSTMGLMVSCTFVVFAQASAILGWQSFGLLMGILNGVPMLSGAIIQHELGWLTHLLADTDISTSNPLWLAFALHACLLLLTSLVAVSQNFRSSGTSLVGDTKEWMRK